MVRISALLHIFTYAIALLGIAPIFPHIDPFAKMIFALTTTAGVFFDSRERHPLPGFILPIASVGFFAYYAFQFSMANLVLPALNLLAILLGISLAGKKKPRNHLQIFALSLFALAGSSLLSLSGAFLFYLALQITFISISLVLLTFHASDEALVLNLVEIKRLISYSLIIPVFSLLLMIFFFFILPRTEYPLWNFLNSAGRGVTGFSERVSPGASSSIEDTKAVALRVKCDRLSKGELYWRGIVLNAFDGSAWVRRGAPPDEVALPPVGKGFSQLIYAEPNRGSYLIALNLPVGISGVKNNASADHVFTLDTAASRRLRYSADSVITEVTGAREVDREFYLRLPKNISPRISALARELFAGARSDGEKLSRLERFYISQRFSYSTKELPTGKESTALFLLEQKRGHCELFASSFALLLRLGGVPSRLVGGYYGGDYNDIGGYYVITEDMAHVWVEAHIAGRGWVKVDPSSFAWNSGSVEVVVKQKGLLRRIASFADLMSYYWNQVVITYDLEKQINLINSAGQGLKGFRFSFNPRKALPFALILIATGAVLLLWRNKISATPEERILKRFYARVYKRFGVRGGDGMGLHELAASLDSLAVREFADIYYGAVFRDKKLTEAELKRLNEILRSL